MTIFLTISIVVVGLIIAITIEKLENKIDDLESRLNDLENPSQDLYDNLE